MSITLTQDPVVLFLGKATVILIGALLATLAMQRASAGARHLVWLVTLGTLLLVPALTAWGPIRLAVLPARPAAARPAGTGATPAASAAIPPETPMVSGTAAWGSVAPAERQVDAATTTQPPIVQHYGRRSGWLTGAALVAVVWVIVALAIVAVLLRDALMLRRIVRRSTPLEAPEWRDILWEIADRLELPDTPRLLRSADSKMPFACGVRRATIVLPAECDGWSLARRRAVLLHELAHVRRHDLVGHMLGRIACAVYWFHPLVWTAARRLRSESERACDDLALGCGTQASDYAEHLLEIVTSVRRASTPTVALAMARRKEFEGRMLAILDPDVRRTGPKRWESGALVVSLATMAILVGAATPARKPAQRIAQSVQRTTPRGESAAARTPLPGVSAMTSRAASAAAGRIDSTLDFALDSAVPMVPQASRETVRGAIARALASASASVVASRGNDAAAQRSGHDGPPEERAALLIKVLQTDTSARVRRTAAWGLGQLAALPSAATALVVALQHDTDAGVRSNAAWGLAQSSRASSVARDALTAAVQRDPDTRVRSQAAWALGSIASSASLPALVAALRDSSESVRSNAAWAIGTIAPRTAPQGVTDALRDPSERVRANAAWALFNIHDPASAAALNAAFQHETNERVQVSLLEALGTLGDAGMPALRAALNSSSARVKAAAVEALSMGGRGNMNMHLKLHMNPDPNPDPNP